MAANLLLVAAFALLPPISVATEIAPLWVAPADNVHTRRLAGRKLSTLETTLNVERNDYWDGNCPTVTVTYEDDDKSLVPVYFSDASKGTQANCGSKMPGGLEQGMQVLLEGAIETNAEAATILNTELAAPPGTAAQTGATVRKRDGPVFVATKVTPKLLHTSVGIGGGTSPSEVQALVILVKPCTESMNLDAAVVENAIFNTASSDSFAHVFKQCSRNMASVSGKVVGPISVCPTVRGNGETWREVQKILKSTYNVDYDAHKYKILIQPDDWQDSIGSGQLGGTVSWVRASYYHEAAMHLHEVGHNLRLHHASNSDGTDEYGDESSAMGFCCDKRCYSFIHSWQLGWSNTTMDLLSSDVGSLTDVNLKEFSLNADSGVSVKLAGTTDYVVLSYRGKSGFDGWLGSKYQNEVHVHKYAGMHARKTASMTYLMVSANEGDTVGIPDTSLKLTWHATAGNMAMVRICQSLGSTSACGSSGGPAPTQRPTVAPSQPVWTSYFTEKQEAGEVTSQAMVGIGCKGEYCEEVKTAHSQVIRVDLSAAQWKVSTADVAAMTCDAGQVVSRLKCKGTYCARLEVECSPVLGGKLVASAATAGQAWIPETLHATAEGTCPSGSVITSIRCGGTSCAKKQIICESFEQTGGAACGGDGSCSSLGLECGLDGCGNTCGTCGSPKSCLGSSSRCVTLGIEADWLSDSKDMISTGITATGMSCKGRFCAEVRLSLMGVTVDLTKKHESGWISDNTGKKFLWNYETDDQLADCPDGQVVTRVECRGSYCDDLRLECATPNSWKVDTLGQPWVESDWFSEEGSGRQDCPEGFAMTGLECEKSKNFPCLSKCNDYCDNKRIRCRQLVPQGIGAANLGIANTMEIASAQAPSIDCDETCRTSRTISLAIASGTFCPGAHYSIAFAILFWIVF